MSDSDDDTTQKKGPLDGPDEKLESDSADKAPGVPSKDDAPLGSTDQHSDA